ncbi:MULTISPECIES: GntR family transcriptional regulator [unclassified Sphingomonas]|uniref:GntR family transcriptional regulator n=1 Tax=unclassified Sphingomonas TaxID=196159 RepID=UPI00082D430D|nr:MULTISPECIES: GntR family transcriptional regulator [unclassified Sphingomonas]MCH4893282.1 UTRA domain-containing protein [Sphingomonas sp. SFZ2018-12]
MSARADFSAPANTPIYLRLAADLRDRIVTGEIAIGDALPSERDLCDLMGASRVTVRRAIETLIDEGLIVRRQGSGTYVAPRIQAPNSYLSSFSQDARARGEKTQTIWMMKTRASASAEEAAILEVAAGAAVIRLGRVRLAGGEPLAIENAIVPALFLPDLEQLGDSLYETLERGGFRPVSGTQRIRASLATSTEAGLLSMQEGAEILRIERLTRLADGRAVEFTRSAYRGDRYEFVSELRGPYALL